MPCKYVGEIDLGPGMGNSLMYKLGECKVIVSGEFERASHGWHFSISHPTRYPTWEEQKQARYELIPDEVYMVSFMPPRKEFVNRHPNCFHWWELSMMMFDPKTGKPTC